MSLVMTCSEDVPLMEFMYLVFTCMPGESYHDSGLCCVCIINSFALGFVLFEIV